MTKPSFYLTFTVLVNNERWGEKIKIEADNFEQAEEKAKIVFNEYTSKIFNGGKTVQTKNIKLSNMEESTPYQPKSSKDIKEDFRNFIKSKRK